MTAQDVTVFGEAMHTLGETFNEPVSTLRMEAFFDALSDLSIADVNTAVRLALRQCKFFPRPVELRELVLGTADGNADTAWGELQREVQRVGYIGTPTFSDERTARAINETWGSWRRLCETLPGEGPELIGWMKQFKGAFQSLDKRDLAQRLDAGTINPKVLEFITTEKKRLGMS